MKDFGEYYIIKNKKKYITQLEKYAELTERILIKNKKAVFGWLIIYTSKKREWIVGIVIPISRDARDSIVYSCISSLYKDKSGVHTIWVDNHIPKSKPPYFKKPVEFEDLLSNFNEFKKRRVKPGDDIKVEWDKKMIKNAVYSGVNKFFERSRFDYELP